MGRLGRRTAAGRGPLTALGRWTVRRGTAVLLAASALLTVCAAVAAGAQDALELSRWDAPGTDSAAVQDILREEYGTGSPNLALLVTARDGDVDSTAVTAAGQDLTAEVADHPQVTDVTSYWDGGNPALRGDDGERALVLARLEGSATETRAELADLSPQLARETAVLTVAVTGQDEVFRQAGEQARQDFLTAELIILPVVFGLLVLFYRRTLAAALTLAVGLLSVAGTLVGLRLLALVTEVSTFAANLALVLGLGLGIDYSLFVLSRFRQEWSAALRADPAADRGPAVVRTVATAGRTVLFSGLTVAVSLSALLLFPFFFLRSFAYAGVLVVATAVLGATLVLPAALARWGHRMVRPEPPDGGRQLWHRAALAVMRRPVGVGAAALGVLLLAASPVLGLRLGLPDERALPEDASSRQAAEARQAHFAAEATDTLFVTVPGTAGTDDAELARYAAALSRVAGVFHVESTAGTHRAGERVAPPGADSSDLVGRGGGRLLTVVPTQQVMAGELAGGVPGFVSELRAVPAPEGTLVGGFPADVTDLRQVLLDRLPLVAGLVLLVTYGVLLLMTGSVLLPLKATVLNLLSLTVMFGALVWIFQEGRMSGLLGFTPAGSLEPSIPVLMFCVTYGLSMDYEVFLLSRIREEYLRTGDTRHAVAVGIRRTAPLITAAAGILALAFASYATSGVVFLKMLGLGTALVILADATLVRLVLLPAAMRLAGGANWWAPRPLRRLHQRHDPPREEPTGGTAGAGGGPGPAAATLPVSVRER